MNILICSEFYHPSIGGAQKVTQELSSNLSTLGHNITVATSLFDKKLPRFEKINNINVYRFNISGNYVKGIKGKIEDYQNFLIKKRFDVILFYAAQQCTFDAAIPILEKIKSNLYLATCGFSRIKNLKYKKYFHILPSVMKKINCNIVHSNNYQDALFLKKNNIRNRILIPNAAGSEFLSRNKKNFLKKFNIKKNGINILNVATYKFNKGQDLSILAFMFIKSKQDLNLIFVGDKFDSKIYKIYLLLLKIFVEFFSKKKKIYFLKNISRDYVNSSFFDSNLFIFTSRLECSPLVIFESSAAGLPFFSLEVGNVKEISKWTKCGIVFKNIFSLSTAISSYLSDKKKIKKLSHNGIKKYKEKYNWKKISLRYLNAFKKYNF